MAFSLPVGSCLAHCAVRAELVLSNWAKDFKHTERAIPGSPTVIHGSGGVSFTINRSRLTKFNVES